MHILGVAQAIGLGVQDFGKQRVDNVIKRDIGLQFQQGQSLALGSLHHFVGHAIHIAPDFDGNARQMALGPDVVAFEDTEAGVASARGAGMRCLAVRGTHPDERLAAADGIVDAIDAELVRALVG